MKRTASIAPLLAIAAAAAGTGCPGSPRQVRIDEWCMAMETATRDRHVACDLPGDPIDDAEIARRCAALPATSLLEAFDRGEVGWNGAIASARVRALDGCDDASATDDPVLGSVPPGGACRVFSDTWGMPDDCEYGARCLAPIGGDGATCFAIVGEGEACDAVHACDTGLVCGDDGLCAPGA